MKNTIFYLMILLLSSISSFATNTYKTVELRGEIYLNVYTPAMTLQKGDRFRSVADLTFTSMDDRVLVANEDGDLMTFQPANEEALNKTPCKDTPEDEDCLKGFALAKAVDAEGAEQHQRDQLRNFYASNNLVLSTEMHESIMSRLQWKPTQMILQLPAKDPYLLKIERAKPVTETKVLTKDRMELRHKSLELKNQPKLDIHHRKSAKIGKQF